MKVYAVSEGAEGWMWEPKDWPNELETFPYVFLQFNDNEDEAYAPNLIDPWVPLLFEKIKIRAMQLDHIKRYNRQLWAKAGTIPKAEQDKFAKGQTGALNFYSGEKPPEAATYPPIQTDIYAIEGRLDLDKDNVSGQPNAVRSAPQRTQSRTLGEIDRLISSFQARQTDPAGRVEDFSADIAYLLAANIKQYLPGKKWVQATNREFNEIAEALGRDRFDGRGFIFSKAEIKGAEFEVDVKVGSSLPLDSQGRMESMFTMLKLGPSIGVNPNTETSFVIGKNLFQEFGIKEIELAYEKEITNIRAKQEALKAAKRTQAEENVRKARDLEAREAERVASGDGAGPV